jgi:excinuclease ABC subunit C
VVRDGKVIHSHCHLFRSSLPLAEVLGSFLAQYYLAERYIPPEVLCGSEFPDREILEASLRERRGGPVTIAVPQRGKKLELVEMARSNAENFFQVERTRAERMDLLVASLKERLGLRPPGPSSAGHLELPGPWRWEPWCDSRMASQPRTATGSTRSARSPGPMTSG